MNGPTGDPDTVALDRARSAVMNVLVVVGLGIGLTGFLLGRRVVGAWLPSPRGSERVAYGLLLLLCFLSVTVRRAVGARSQLRDPSTRAARFWWAHVLGAAIGALAMPMGLAYGWLILPRLAGVWPFWVAALALTALSYPRSIELEGFDQPMPG